ncbi:MAG: hypothetical protein SFT90_01335 [Rickettsiales bacterium]|nr:hypothetical protein [Rickettsiales bacterium]
MKSYNTLIKLSKQQLDAKRRELTEILDKKESFLNKVKFLEEELRSEFKLISANNNIPPEIKSQFLAYANGVLSKQSDLMREAEKLNPEINKLNEEIFVLFTEMKKIEIYRDNKIQEIEELSNKKNQLELDEVAINSFIRNQKFF